MKPLVKNAADESQVNNAKIKKQLLDDQNHNDLKFILDSAQGRRYIWRVLERCGVFKSSFVTSSEIYFNEGKRDIGLKILAEIMECDPQAYLKMATNKDEKNDRTNNVGDGSRNN